MALNNKILEKHEMMFQNWEPRMKNRFIVEWNQVPSYLIKAVNIHIEKDKNKIELKIYDPIVPTPMEAVIKKCLLNNEEYLKLKILGPVGDIVDTYSLKIRNLSTNFSYDWASGELSILEVTADLIDIVSEPMMKPLSESEKEAIVEKLAPGLKRKVLNFPNTKDTVDLANKQVKALKKKARSKND